MSPSPTPFRATPRPASTPKRHWLVTLSVLFVNVLIVAALGIGRITTILTTGQGLVAAVASTFVLMAAAAGVPWCFEFVARRVRPVAPLLRQRWNVRFALRAEHRRREHARDKIAAAKALSSAWTQESARITAIYQLAYRLAIAKQRTMR